MSNNRSLTPNTILFILIAVILWGWAFPLIKVTLEFLPPIVIGYFRYFFASLPFILYLFYKFGFKSVINELRSGWVVILALALTMITLPNIAQNIGLKYTSSSLAALITTAAPVFTVIIAILFLKESKSSLKIVGLVIAIIASVLIVFLGGFEMEGTAISGNILIFITAVSYGVCGIFGKIALRNYSPVFVVGFSMFIGSILLIPISLILNEPVDWSLHLSFEGWTYLWILTLLPCMVATFLWYVVLRAHEVSRQVLFTYLIPVFAAITAYLMLGELLTPSTIFMGVVIFIGITLAEIDLKNEKNEKMI